MISERALLPLWQVMGYQPVPTGWDRLLWRAYMRIVGPMFVANVYAGEVHPEEALLELAETSFFFRLPRWSDCPALVFTRLAQSGLLAPVKVDVWRRRFLSDFAGLEASLGGLQAAKLLEPMVRNYLDLLTKVTEEPDPDYPVMLGEKIERQNFSSWPAEVEKAIFELTGAEPSSALVEAMSTEAERRLSILASVAPPHVVRAALADLLHFLGLPRLSLAKRGLVDRVDHETLPLLLTL